MRVARPSRRFLVLDPAADVEPPATEPVTSPRSVGRLTAQIHVDGEAIARRVAEQLAELPVRPPEFDPQAEAVDSMGASEWGDTARGRLARERAEAWEAHEAEQARLLRRQHLATTAIYVFVAVLVVLQAAQVVWKMREPVQDAPAAASAAPVENERPAAKGQDLPQVPASYKLYRQLPGGKVGSYYSVNLNRPDSRGIHTITGGALPPGLALSHVGVIGGTPSTAGTWRFDLTVANPDGSTVTAPTMLEINR